MCVCLSECMVCAPLSLIFTLLFSDTTSHELAQSEVRRSRGHGQAGGTLGSNSTRASAAQAGA